MKTYLRGLGDTPVIDIPDYTVINTTETPAQAQNDADIANLLGPQTNTPLPAPMVQKSGVITTDLTKQGAISPVTSPTVSQSASSMSKYIPYAVARVAVLLLGIILLRHKKTVRHARVAYENPRHKKEATEVRQAIYERAREPFHRKKKKLRKAA